MVKHAPELTVMYGATLDAFLERLSSYWPGSYRNGNCFLFPMAQGMNVEVTNRDCSIRRYGRERTATYVVDVPKYGRSGPGFFEVARRELNEFGIIVHAVEPRPRNSVLVGYQRENQLAFPPAILGPYAFAIREDCRDLKKWDNSETLLKKIRNLYSKSARKDKKPVP